MKKILLWTLVVLAIGACLSCTIGDTGTLALKNDSDSVHTITAVNFAPTAGGTTVVRAHTIPPGERHYIYSIEPGMYNIIATFEGHGDVTVESNFLVEDGTVYLRSVLAQ
jgi:hypothetical protein